MGNGKRLGLPLMLVVLFNFVFVPSALAHKVTVFAWVEDGTVFTESKLGGGKRIKEGDIFVYDGNSNLLLKGKTNDQGEFSFPLPQAPPLIVELNAGMGHMARWTLTPEDADLSDIPGNESEAGKKEDLTETNPDVAAQNHDLQRADHRDLAAMVERSVERAVDKKLRPMMKILVDMHAQKTSFSDIIGGIGYILGLVGLVAYFKSRKN